MSEGDCIGFDVVVRDEGNTIFVTPQSRTTLSLLGVLGLVKTLRQVRLNLM